MNKAKIKMKARRRRHRYGLWAEFLCRCLLRLKGYRILAARYRSPFGEIDIIAARGAVVAVIEVKARQNMADAALAFTSPQRDRLRRSASMFLARHPGLTDSAIRFDLMLVAPLRAPRHIPNAWEGL
ncbi:MAG: YraN family protein [Alphaproteobacteria bacterium]